MAGSWREKIRRVGQRIFDPERGSSTTPAPAPSVPPLHINLGIDFGTSFTKVCFRDVGREQSGIVVFSASACGGARLESALIPSVVIVAPDGRLSVTPPRHRSGQEIAVRYLKMRLAREEFPESLPVVAGTDLGNERVPRALSAWFLATVLARARSCVEEHEAERTRGRRLVWSANVGVPVEYCDSDTIDVFREVLAVAWMWTENHDIPARLSSLLECYDVACKAVGSAPVDCHAVPEIAAAVRSFISSREAGPGVFVYFDIGGGTVDGVVFRYVTIGGRREINFYCGKVEPLGISAIASHLSPGNLTDVENALVEGAPTTALCDELKPFEDKLKRLVGHVVMNGKRKDGGNWLRDKFQSRTTSLGNIVPLSASQVMPLTVFVGGGGAGSEWYQRTIRATHRDFDQFNAGIPPYELKEVPKPVELDMRGLEDVAFRRFAIAYGLSVPYGEGPEIRLPSQVPDPESPKPAKPRGMVDYEDSKDVYD